MRFLIESPGVITKIKPTVIPVENKERDIRDRVHATLTETRQLTGKDGYNGFVYRCHLLLLEHIASEEGDDEQDNGDEERPRGEELFLGGITLCSTELMVSNPALVFGSRFLSERPQRKDSPLRVRHVPSGSSSSSSRPVWKDGLVSSRSREPSKRGGAGVPTHELRAQIDELFRHGHGWSGLGWLRG
jgi:hypothetical protein